MPAKVALRLLLLAFFNLAGLSGVVMEGVAEVDGDARTFGVSTEDVMFWQRGYTNAKTHRHTHHRGDSYEEITINKIRIK